MQAAQAAGMPVVVIPSLVGKQWYADCSKCTMLASLLDFHPSDFGLPAFTDSIHGTVPLEEAWTIRGEVVKGFGRGSKVRLRRLRSLCSFAFVHLGRTGGHALCPRGCAVLVLLPLLLRRLVTSARRRRRRRHGSRRRARRPVPSRGCCSCSCASVRAPCCLCSCIFMPLHAVGEALSSQLRKLVRRSWAHPPQNVCSEAIGSQTSSQTRPCAGVGHTHRKRVLRCGRARPL